jgi:hypothetical protein
LEESLKNFRVLAYVVSLIVLLQLVNAQTLPKSPISGGVLAARAYRAGLLHPVETNHLLPSGTILTCSPTPCVLPNVQASGGGQPVNEDPIATNLKNAKQLLTGGNDYNCSNIQGFYSSADGGSTWTRTCSPGSGGDGDPIVGYDLNNVAYAGGIQNSDVVLFSSTNNGQTWGTPVVVSTPLLGSLADKPWLEIDTNAKSPFVNSLYVSITQFDGSSDSEISVSHSNDGGKTWTTKVVDTEQFYPTSVDQFSDLAVGADGTVYVSWQRCAANGQAGDCGGTVAKMLLSKSTDGGNTWSAPVTIATPTLVPDSCGCGFYGSLPNTDERVSNIPSNAVFGSGSTAKVYVSFYNWNGSQMQVFVAASKDGGNTFGTPVRVTNSNKGDEFFQWINVAQNGAIGVTWLDRRNDPANLQYQPFAAVSTNGGGSVKSGALSTTMSNPLDDGFGGGFMGDYRCHVFNGHTMFAAWMDMRTDVSQDEVGGAQF